MNKGIIIPEAVETLLVSRALGENAAAKASRGYLSGRELADVTEAMLELSDRFNGIDPAPLGQYMQSRWHRAAYYLYFLPANFAKAWAVLAELAPTLAGKDKVSILDVGSGPGSLSLGIFDFLARKTSIRQIRILALDSSREALEDAKFLLRGYAAALAAEGIETSLSLDTRVTDIAAAEPPEGQWDVVLFGDSLNELFRGTDDPVARRAELMAAYAAQLAEGGAVAAIEPALKDISRDLQAVRDVLASSHGLHIYAPCLRQEGCPMLAPGHDRDWCHTAALWTRPRIVRRIDKVTGRNRFVVKFAYVVARNEAGYPVKTRSNVTPFRAVGDRITEKGKSHMLVCGAPGCSPCTLLTRDESKHTDAFTGLHRGDVVSLGSYEERKDGIRLSESSRVKVLRAFSS